MPTRVDSRGSGGSRAFDEELFDGASASHQNRCSSGDLGNGNYGEWLMVLSHRAVAWYEKSGKPNKS